MRRLSLHPFLATIALGILVSSPVHAEHGYALWGDLKYPKDFAHFTYVDPKAPRGGELRMVSGLRSSNVDKYNPFILKGTAPAYLSDAMFDTLLAASWDETGAGYGLLAEDVTVPPDRLSATFRMRKEARFHNGDPVLAADVKHSYDMLVGPDALPSYKTILEEVEGVDTLDERTVRFRFKKPNRDLPLVVGALPVFSRKWGMENGKPKRFRDIVWDIPIGSGPYKIGGLDFGRDIMYVRDPNYWARDLNVRRGMANFERVVIKIYRDNTAQMEALKAGEFEMMRFFSSGDWARRLTGRKFDSGELVKVAFRHRQPYGFQSYIPNGRRPLLGDWRVRKALNLAMDFEWMSRQMFYGAYSRGNGLFGNTECQPTAGPPSVEEAALMEPLKKWINPAAFGPMTAQPRTDGESSLRQNLREAQRLLKEAGWEVRDGALRNAQGQPFVIEHLESTEGQPRTTASWFRNLEKLGIKVNYRQVDFAIYQQRLRTFDFDMVSLNLPGTHSPGQEYADLFGSKAADVEDSGNYAGVKNPAIDALIGKMTQASAKPEFLAACRALDRVFAHGHYFIPAWTQATYRVVYNQWRLTYKDAEQRVIPPYPPEPGGHAVWAMLTWWAKPQPGPSSASTASSAPSKS